MIVLNWANDKLSLEQWIQKCLWSQHPTPWMFQHLLLFYSYWENIQAAPEWENKTLENLTFDAFASCERNVRLWAFKTCNIFSDCPIELVNYN